MVKAQSTSTLDDFMSLEAATLNVAGRQSIIMGREWQPLLRYYEAAEVTEESAELPIGLGHSIYKCSVTKVSQEDLVPENLHKGFKVIWSTGIQVFLQRQWSHQIAQSKTALCVCVPI